jgi:beta-glucuronidase
MLSRIPQIRVFPPSVLMDFRSLTWNIPLLQDGYSRKGLISEDGKEKESFSFTQKIYKDVTQKIYKDGAYGKAE